MRQPALFIGHGSPMNAIAKNRYTEFLAQLGQSLPRPQAILMISAHWMTKGTFVTESANPRTIHDFGGFPQALFDIEYPAPGATDLVQKLLGSHSEIQGDQEKWGLDHGAWSLLLHMYPAADVPVAQLSLDMTAPPRRHFEWGRRLAPFRDEGVMILASGNLVHNLRQIRWEENAPPFPWAVEFDSWLKEKIEQKDSSALIDDFQNSEAGRLSVPTLEHYLPLLYILGAATPDDPCRTVYEEIQNGSISMRSVRFG